MSNLNLNSVTSLDTGREVDVNRVMQTVDYVGGLVIDSRDTVIVDGDDRYALAASAALPYTTTGAGMPEGGAFVSVGDAKLRGDLVQPVATFDSVADMVNATGLTIGRKVRTLGYYNPGDGGGNDYEIVAAGTGTNDGGSYINLAGSSLQAKGAFSEAQPIDAKKFGLTSVGDADGGLTTEEKISINTAAFKNMAALNSANSLYNKISIPSGTYYINEKISFSNAVSLKGQGRHTTTIAFVGTGESRGFYIPYKTLSPRIEVSGFTVFNLNNETGVCFEIEGDMDGNSHGGKHRFYTSDIEIGGINGCFETGYFLNKVFGSYASRIVYSGKEGASGGANTGTMFKLFSLDANGALQVSVHHDFNQIIMPIGHCCLDVYNCEGVFIRGFQMPNCDFGIKWDSPLTEAVNGRPHLHAGPGHINSKQKGICFKSGSQSFISDILFYRNPSAVAGHIDVEIDDGLQVSVDNCKFPSNAEGRKAIVSRNSRYTRVSNNDFYGGGETAIEFDGGDLSTVYGNDYSLTGWENRFVNLGSDGCKNKELQTRLSCPNLTLADGWSLVSQLPVSIDGDNNHGLTVDAGNFSVNNSGLYSIRLHSVMSAGAAGNSRIGLFKNGSLFAESASPTGSSRPTTLELFWQGQLRARDVIEVRISQETGESKNLTQTSISVNCV